MSVASFACRVTCPDEGGDEASGREMRAGAAAAGAGGGSGSGGGGSCAIRRHLSCVAEMPAAVTKHDRL